MKKPSSNYEVTKTPLRETYYFHGEASGAMARIDKIGVRQVNLVSPVDGQSTLPTIGGMARSSVGGSLARFAEFVHYGRCETSADGKTVNTGRTPQAETAVSASVSNFRVLNRPAPRERVDVTSVEFEADRVAIAIKSIHPKGGQHDFLLKEATVDNMWIVIRRANGTESIPIQLKLFPLKMHASGLPYIKGFPSTPLKGGMSHGSIVRAVVRNGEEHPGHVLTELGLGTIYFGETLMSAQSRRITMVRIKMGSDANGDVSAGAVGANGVWP